MAEPVELGALLSAQQALVPGGCLAAVDAGLTYPAGQAAGGQAKALGNAIAGEALLQAEGNSLRQLLRRERPSVAPGLRPLLFRRRIDPRAGHGAEAELTDACPLLAMPQIDLLLAAELLVVMLVVASMDAPSPRLKAAEPALEEPEPPVLWTAETNPHAQRILRLESRRTAGPAPLR